ncbi:hypothetical protein K469DRAFT_310987 [Zopfia rhizophila CBS 207.26]|uniref:Uncharacterized protein n=1 Tax=Zopfia rhizophila CBS 207.26 TaxID=1314779 RepID=A0A6A6EJU5_9PEZI|nr:hypothetical protein K469DRAFT_310987 [Zopfia rhizophila CBS 207.26]
MASFVGKVIAIIGGASGIGIGTVNSLHREAPKSRLQTGKKVRHRKLRIQFEQREVKCLHLNSKFEIASRCVDKRHRFPFWKIGWSGEYCWCYWEVNWYEDGGQTGG